MQKPFSKLHFDYEGNVICEKSGEPDFLLRYVRFDDENTYIPFSDRCSGDLLRPPAAAAPAAVVCGGLQKWRCISMVPLLRRSASSASIFVFLRLWWEREKGESEGWGK